MAAPDHSKYTNQRKPVAPPHVSIRNLRTACGLTIDQLLERIRETTGRTYTRGAISAVENGIRGASRDLCEDIAQAYGLEINALDTTYEPRVWGGAA